MDTAAGASKRRAAMNGMQMTSTAVTGICHRNWLCKAVASDARMLSVLAGDPPEMMGTLVAGTRKKKSLNGDVSEAAPAEPPQAKPTLKSQKIGDKVRALQQLVSPFGKTDTASVLEEATAQIRLLHERIRVLSMPYFEYRSVSTKGSGNGKFDLQSKGLCLVPMSSLGSLETRDNGDRGRASTSPFLH